VLVLDVRCSKGTYVRTLAEDIGEALGCGAHLAALRRTASGPLTLEHAVTLEQLADLEEPQRDALLRPADALLADWPHVRLGDDDAGRFLSGLRRRVNLADQPAVRVYGPQPRAFLGSAHVQAGELIADRLLSPAEVQGLLSTPS
jgi:tRNA pseudouridine55 synthase